MSCSCSRRRSVWSSNTRTAAPGSAMGIVVSSRMRSPNRISTEVAAASAMARATGSDHAGGLERDRRLSKHGGDERELGLAEAPGAVPREGHGTHRAAGCDEGCAQPGPGRLLYEIGPAPARLFLHVLREGEGAPAQRQLEE